MKREELIVYYNEVDDEIIMGEVMHEEITHFLFTKDGETWTSSLLVPEEEFVFFFLLVVL